MGIHDREHLEVATAAQLTSWLAEHHTSSPGLWVVTHKKGSGKPAPSYDEIVRAALCFGWIDSVPGKVDDARSKLYISPRKTFAPISGATSARLRGSKKGAS
jgi:uncharacterized protein YdeI (YjbR/CyaY-like superfamily)